MSDLYVLYFVLIVTPTGMDQVKIKLLILYKKVLNFSALCLVHLLSKSGGGNGDSFVR